MRACHVVYGYFPFDPRVRREVDTLVRLGHEIDVIAMREPGQAIRETAGTVRVHRVPFEVVRGGKLRYLFQYAVFFMAASALLFLLHRQRRFHVVHVHSLPDFQVFGALPQKFAGVRIVLDLHEAMPEILAARMGAPPSGGWARLAMAMERASCALADHVVTVNEAIRNLLVSRGVEQAKISVVMNSPDPALLKVKGGGGLRKALGISSPKAIVYVGGMNPERDLGLLIRAVARLRATLPLDLVIFGYGDPAYRHVLEDVAREEGLESGFQLGPRLPQEEVFSYVSVSDIGPITYEKNPLTELAVPNKVFEYAAAMKPLVIANLKALRRLFEGAALFYEPGDADDLARQIRRVLEEDDLRETLVRNASRVFEACRWEVMASRLAQLYSDVATSGG